MTLTLAPEIEERIHELVSSGRYASPEEVVSYGVNLLVHDRLPNSFSNAEELNALIEEGIRSAENEPLLSTSEVKAHLSARFGFAL